MSVSVMKKAEEIEKLAHTVKEKMKGHRAVGALLHAEEKSGHRLRSNLKISFLA